MPVGTYGTVKGMLPRDIEEIGAHIILGNTFHLMLRPGTEVVKAHGDLHDFTQWQGPILTDSGGFQVFSLGEMRKITEQGVTFRSPVDGSKVELSPEIAIQVQRGRRAPTGKAGSCCQEAATVTVDVDRFSAPAGSTTRRSKGENGLAFG